MSGQANFEHFLENTIVNINSQITPAPEAKISVFDRGFLYGDSIYEVTYSEEGALLYFDNHLDRLFNSADLLDMHMHITREQIIEESLKTLEYSQYKRAYIRIIITRGETEITLDPNASFKNNFVIIVKPLAKYPEIMYQEGLNLIISNVLRNHRDSVNPNAKSGNYLNNVMAIKEAKKLSADDAIMINQAGKITEGTTFNIWCVKDGVIYTPPEKSGLLKGITRKKVIELCKKENLEYSIEEFDKNFILSAQEVFITSSTKGVMPVRKINNIDYGNSIEDWPYIQKISSFYFDNLKHEISNSKYKYL